MGAFGGVRQPIVLTDLNFERLKNDFFRHVDFA